MTGTKLGANEMSAQRISTQTAHVEEHVGEKHPFADHPEIRACRLHRRTLRALYIEVVAAVFDVATQSTLGGRVRVDGAR